MTTQLLHGDCLEVLKTLSDASVDAIVTDPPYGLEFMGKEWDKCMSESASGQRKGDAARITNIAAVGGFQDGAGGNAYSRARIRFGAQADWMQQVEWHRMWVAECLRVLKPGGHLLAFGATRTYHRMACAIEDAGFEIRDSIHWVYGSGFPKSLNVGKSMEGQLRGNGARYSGKDPNLETVADQTVPGSLLDEAARRTMKEQGAAWSGASVSVTTDTAKQWVGWGTALKPSHEPVVVARKPLAGTVAANVERYGTGALNIDGCRVETDETITNHSRSAESAVSKGKYGDSKAQETHQTAGQALGRWPPNLLLSHTEDCTETECVEGCAIREMDRQSGPKKASFVRNRTEGARPFNNNGAPTGYVSEKVAVEETDGGASRFFPVFKYQAKPSRKEREAGCDNLDTKSMGMSNGAQLHGEGYDKGQDIGLNRVVQVKNNHPTVKPIALMEWLVTLVTPPNGVVLDPFMGSGTTGIAAVQKGFSFIGIEREAEYLEIARARLAAAKPPVEKAPKPEQLTLLP